jgi:hypothetical protein
MTAWLTTVLVLASIAIGCGGREVSGTYGPSAEGGSRPSSQDLCNSICASIAQPKCANGQDLPSCLSGCAGLYSHAPQCRETIDTYLSCLIGVPLDCTIISNAKGPPSACQASYAATQTCVGSTPAPAGSGAPPSTRPPPPGCETVPPKPASVSCGGSGTGSGSSGGSLPMCQERCTDNQGNSWSADCSGTMCTCSYDGKQLCTCTLPATGCTGTPCCP